VRVSQLLLRVQPSSPGRHAGSRVRFVSVERLREAQPAVAARQFVVPGAARQPADVRDPRGVQPAPVGRAARQRAGAALAWRRAAAVLRDVVQPAAGPPVLPQPAPSSSDQVAPMRRRSEQRRLKDQVVRLRCQRQYETCFLLPRRPQV
jgi:hypothetical protein